ncbi:MAG: hypothetical protein SFY56_06580 [Bacteroidota bacterium]|nr:hypothetical protein [Bacteroidota bacterium]
MKKILSIVYSNRFLVLLDQAIYSGIGFLVTIFLAHNIEVVNFGLYSSLILVSFLIISFSNALIIQPFQVSSEAYRNSKEYSDFLFFFQILFNVLLLISAIIVLNILKPFQEANMSTLFLLFGMVFHDFSRKYFLGKSLVSHVLAIDFISGIFQFLSLFLLWRFAGLNLNFIFLALGLPYFITLIYVLIVIKPSFSFLKNRKEYLVFHKKEGVWLCLVSFVQWGSANFFIVTLGIFVNVEALGAFRLVQSIFGVLNVLFQTYENYVLPTASKLYSSSMIKSKQYLKSISIQSSIITGIILLLLFVFSKDIMFVVGGDKYVEYNYTIKGMCVLYFILFLGYPIRISIRILLLSKSFFIGYLMAFVFSILFFNVLIKQFQLNGIVIGLIINQFIMLLFWNYQLHKKNFYLWK